jgi:nanoRNase/pAp phosphatase (c-di-AMP/oligoRNAs hydrolase)
MSEQYRLVTRSDLDGMVSAALLRKLGMINRIKFVHPKDMQDGKVELTGQDITTNLPYVESVHLAFDHHSSEAIRIKGPKSNYVNDPHAPSAARVVYNYFGGKAKFPDVPEDMVLAADKVDAAQYSMEDVLHPKGWDLLGFLTDPRTGLGRFKTFRISNLALMTELAWKMGTLSLAELLALPDVKERVDLYFEQEPLFEAQIKRCAAIHKNLVVLDLRDEDPLYVGNRFKVYALFPACNISMHVMWGLKKQNIVFAVGKSIFKRTAKTDVGALMLAYGGGGLTTAGTCQIDTDQADEVKQALIARITADG